MPLDAAILFAPVGDLVLPALEALDRGGTLAIAGIHLSDIAPLNYQRHLFQERQIRSVTSNTRADAREFLDFAGPPPHRGDDAGYPLSRADARDCEDLPPAAVSGAAVLTVDCQRAASTPRTAAVSVPRPGPIQRTAAVGQEKPEPGHAAGADRERIGQPVVDGIDHLGGWRTAAAATGTRRW